jgi:hypothetical protein
MAVFIPQAAITIFVHNGGLGDLVFLAFLVVMGPFALLYGITLDDTERSRRLQSGEDGWLWHKVMGRVPLSMVRLAYIALGSVFTILLLFFLWAGLSSAQ